MALSRWKIWRTYQLLKSSRNVAARHLGTDTAKCYPQPLLKPPFPEYESIGSDVVVIPPDSVRYYYLKTDNKQQAFPSVTTILETTRPAWHVSVLNRWAENKANELGEEGFVKFRNDIRDRGVRVHSLIEDYLATDSEPEVPADLTLHWQSVRPFLKHLSKIYHLEVAAVHEPLEYAGRLDCICEFNGQAYVIDWKTTNKRKRTVKQTFDSPLQLAAYHMAVTESAEAYGLQDMLPLKAMLVMVNADGTPGPSTCLDIRSTLLAADIIEVSDIETYHEQWRQRLHNFRCLWPPMEFIKPS